jgi:hypothetical protein
MLATAIPDERAARDPAGACMTLLTAFPELLDRIEALGLELLEVLRTDDQ